jgi:hypothetical protein
MSVSLNPFTPAPEHHGQRVLRLLGRTSETA